MTHLDSVLVLDVGLKALISTHYSHFFSSFFPWIRILYLLLTSHKSHLHLQITNWYIFPLHPKSIYMRLKVKQHLLSGNFYPYCMENVISVVTLRFIFSHSLCKWFVHIIYCNKLNVKFVKKNKNKNKNKNKRHLVWKCGHCVYAPRTIKQQFPFLTSVNINVVPFFL